MPVPSIKVCLKVGGLGERFAINYPLASNQNKIRPKWKWVSMRFEGQRGWGGEK